MDRSRTCIVGLGEALWDVFPGGEKRLGGAPLNFAARARRLGARAALFSCVGDDAPGHEILARLDALGVNRDGVAVHPNRPTGIVEVIPLPDGQQDYNIIPDVAWDDIPFASAAERIALAADAVCFGSLCQRAAASRESIQRFLESVRPDCRIVFDVNLRKTGPGNDVIRSSMEYAHALKMNADEAPLIGELAGARGDDRAVMKGLADAFRLDLVAVTRGARGCAILTSGGYAEHPGFPASLGNRDTVGAGDAFTAGMALAWLDGESPARIAERANRAAVDHLGDGP